jgi:hypothetical protein
MRWSRCKADKNFGPSPDTLPITWQNARSGACKNLQ